MDSFSFRVLAVFTFMWMEHIIANVIERIDNIAAAPSDRRAYQGLKLQNGLEILLISDPSAEKSAACLSVRVGGLNDFFKVEGLANLVGYLLMKGSQGYSTPHDFSYYVQKHGGVLNAPVTDAHIQRFGFDIYPDYLGAALKRLALSFIEPLLLAEDQNEEFLIDAIGLVRSEFVNRGMLDKYRIPQVERSKCRNNHPYCNLFNGSPASLYEHGNDPKNTLKWKDHKDPTLASLFHKALQFHKNWYSSNNMTLAVLGRETLDKLEEMVVPIFKDLANTNAWKLEFRPPSPFALPWGNEELGYVFHINPVHAYDSFLRLIFPVPDTLKHYKTAPETFISTLISRDGPSSLISVLRDSERLVFNLKTEYTASAGIAFFRIICQLTDLGVKSSASVINVIFQYIHLIELCDEKTLKEAFREVGNLYHMAFLERDYVHETPRTQVELSAALIQDFPMEHILLIGYSLIEWDGLVIKQFLDCLKPNNMNVSIVNSSVLERANRTEKHYETPYRVEKILDGLITCWSTLIHVVPELEFRQHNEFVPDNFDLHTLGENVEKYPSLLHSSSKTEIWFKQDDRFRVPKLHILLQIHTWISKFGANAYVLLYFVCHLLKRSLDEHLRDAKAAGLYWNVEVSLSSEIVIELHGYNHTIPLLLERVLTKVVNFGQEITETYFQAMVDEYFVDFKSRMSDLHVYRINLYLRSLLQGEWCPESVYNAGIKLQYKDFHEFLTKRFRRIFVRALIHGNSTKEQAGHIVDIIEKSFISSGGLLIQEILRPRVTEIDAGQDFNYYTFSNSRNTYAYNSIYQISTDDSDPKVDVASLLFFVTIRDFCLKILSSVEVVGKPFASCELRNFYNMRALSIIITSEKNPQFVRKHVETFLEDAIDSMSTLQEKEFDRIKQIVIDEELRARDLYELSKKYWFDIANGLYNFDRYDRQIDLLHTTTAHNAAAVLRRIIAISAAQKSKLVMHVFPRGLRKTKLLHKTMPQQMEKC